MLSVHLAISLVAAGALASSAQELEGKWVWLDPRGAAETRWGGFGRAYEFEAGGSFCAYRVWRRDSVYRMEGDPVTILLGEPGKVTELALDPETDRLIPLVVGGAGSWWPWAPMERVGGSGAEAGSVVGTWAERPDRAAPGDAGESSMLWTFTEDERVLSRWAFDTRCGDFSVSGTSLTLEAGGGSEQMDLRREGGLLSLVSTKEEEERVFERWEGLPYRAFSPLQLPRSVEVPPATGPPWVASLHRSRSPYLNSSLRYLRLSCGPLKGTRRPAKKLKAVPRRVGSDRHFGLIRLGDETEITLMFEKLAGRTYLAYADLDQDLDLTNDRPRQASGAASRPYFPTEVRYTGGSAEYAFGLSSSVWTPGGPVFSYWSAQALVGMLDDRRFAVIDGNMNGFYNDEADILIVDRGCPAGFEACWKPEMGLPVVWPGTAVRQPRHQVVYHRREPLRLADVDPVAATARFERAGLGRMSGRVTDASTGEPIDGARLHFQPGGHGVLTGSDGSYRVEVPEGRLDYISAAAPGFWGVVLQGEQLAAVPVAGGGTQRIDFELRPTPCAPELRWCGRARLGAVLPPHRTPPKPCGGSMEMNPALRYSSFLDLDSGVHGPRLGPYPSTPDLAWSWGDLHPAGGARLLHLGAVDFDEVGPDVLETAVYPEPREFGRRRCASKGQPGDQVLRPGMVLGVRTREGRYGKIRIDGCERRRVDRIEGFISPSILELSWILYPGVVKRAEPDDPGPYHGVPSPAPGLARPGTRRGSAAPWFAIVPLCSSPCR